MASIFESIEILSKEKGIDPQIVITAVKDAMLVAARKQFRTNEDLVAEVDDKANVIHIYAVKKVVDAVEDPLNQLTLEEAQAIAVEVVHDVVAAEKERLVDVHAGGVLLEEGLRHEGGRLAGLAGDVLDQG